ncbi:hypothetical protein [Natronoglycomyces albus]|uniref:Uncharacterized protein n=1 Tax=Natronoglycomyces albus TaxID=2811108 RepID=A0A895XS36_9ACTN|nr:hypothetical protein [Natronoglycomyces albus]QSB06502.1 hypothetical protein JQS30_06255 [Natronoglycomyces albus]
MAHDEQADPRFGPENSVEFEVVRFVVDDGLANSNFLGAGEVTESSHRQAGLPGIESVQTALFDHSPLFGNQLGGHTEQLGCLLTRQPAKNRHHTEFTHSFLPNW